jgi:hypothetical protein
MLSVLATGPKVRGFKPGRGDGLLREMKFRSTASFGGEVQPKAPCRKISRHVKRSLARMNRKPNSHSILPFLLHAIR